MDTERFIAQMENTAEVIRQLVEGVSEEQGRWKPDPESWSVLEVVNHLYDEEREDFRVRLDVILHHPDQEAPPIDPAGWVTERSYNQRDLRASLEGYLRERQESIRWLKTLEEPDWDAVYEIKQFNFKIKAGDMFAAWVAHDLLHLRQLVELQWQYTVASVEPYTVNYAGEW